MIDNENIANWEEEHGDDDDEDSTPREESFHDAEERASPDNCPGPGLLRNILEDNITFLTQHPRKPDRTEDQKLQNLRRSGQQKKNVQTIE